MIKVQVKLIQIHRDGKLMRDYRHHLCKREVRQNRDILNSVAALGLAHEVAVVQTSPKQL